MLSLVILILLLKQWVLIRPGLQTSATRWRTNIWILFISENLKIKFSYSHYTDYCVRLWEKSWEDGAVKWQAEPEMAYDPSKVHKIDFEGEYLRCHAYFQTHPSPQRTPVIFQAGASKSGIDFAGKHAEAIYSDNLTFPSLTTYIKDVRSAAVKHGRDPYDVKIFVAIMPFLGATVEEAQAKYDKAKKLVSAQSGLAKICGFTGMDLSVYPYTEPFDLKLDVKDSAITGVVKNLNLRAQEAGVPFTPESLGKLAGFVNTPAPIGTGEMVADVFQEWMEKTDVDGFNIVCKFCKTSFQLAWK